MRVVTELDDRGVRPDHLNHQLVALAASVLAAERSVTDPAEEADLRFGIRVRYARRANGMSQTDLADATGGELSQFIVSRIEQGHTSPRLSTVYALADALGVPAAELLDSP